MMRSYTMELPEDVLDSAKIPRHEWDKVIKRELALQLYREGILSFANARRLAEMDKLSFHLLLGERQIPRQYDQVEYERDLDDLSEWKKRS